MKKIVALLLCLALLAGMSACSKSDPNAPVAGATVPGEGSGNSGDPAENPGNVTPERLPNLMVMSGPTGVGAAKLISDWESGSTVLATATVAADNEEVKNALINGDADIAAVATNVASALYNKTGGAVQVLAINTLGVLYILEKGESVQTMADLAGKTVYATGQGANPEYILNYLLEKSGVDPDAVDIQWMTAQEVIAKMTTQEEAICMLPVPAATTVMMKDSAIRQAISLTDVWGSVDESMLAQGCIVARTDYIKENPQAVANFLLAYEQSLDYMMSEENRETAAALVALYGITANEKIAAKAIPSCNLTFITGSEMKTVLNAFYQVMFQANPASIGGAMPDDSFYYGG